MKTFWALIGFMAITQSVKAARSSASYSVPADSTDGAGVQVQSANYSVKGSAIGEFGAGQTAIATSAAYSSKAGFVGELYDIVGLSITAASSQADDTTTTAALDPSTVTWSILSGPFGGISSSGLATAGTVYQDTIAVVQGVAQSLTGQLSLTVLNVNTDDFGSYAGDGIDDAWQVQYFGQNNSNAVPTADPDGDGQSNYFEYIAGVVPNNPNSRFLISIAPVIGQATQRAIVFSPRLSDRTYTVKSKINLTDPTWNSLTSFNMTDNGQTRTVIDLSASGSNKFYHVEISKP